MPSKGLAGLGLQLLAFAAILLAKRLSGQPLGVSFSSIPVLNR
jgi:hypothetical protein